MAFDFTRLQNSVESSILQMSKPRLTRVNAIRQYVGKHYAAGGTDLRVPTNLLELAVTIYTRLLAARAPRAMISTGIQSLMPYARNMELAMNQIPDEIFLGRTLRRAVIEAIFSLGIVKVGICTSGHTVLGHDYGEPFVDVITLDDYFCDMSAKKMEEIQFEGNDYWLPLEVVRDMAGNDMEADDHTTVGANGEERAESVSTDESIQVYGKRVWVRDVWLPDTGQLVTYGVKSKKQINLVDWDGPKDGPYHKLSFSDVPGNLLPLAPVALMLDLHELANSLYRKLGRQADAKKTVATFPGGSDEDAKALQMAKDGDGIALHPGGKPETLTVGGIDQATLAVFLQTRDLFSYLAGNLDSLGGLAPMSETVGQDKMMSAAANGRIDFMQDQTIDFAKAIFGDLAWYEWTDPVRQRAIEKPIDGTDIVLHRIWSQETRDGDFLDFNFDIDAYSMQNDTPSIRLQKIRQIFDGFVVPLLPIIQQQGGQVDVEKLLELIGRLSNLPELAALIKFQEQSPEQQQQPVGNSQPTLRPANTTHTNVRVNRPGATRHGKDDVMSRLLMGSGVQSSEAAGLGRSVG